MFAICSRMTFLPITLLMSEKRRTVPLSIVKVSAGFPSPAGDDLEDEIDPIDWVVRHPSATFWWRVQGDCLVDVGINDGDLIAVDRQGKKRIGRIILAVVDGSVTAKILSKINNEYWLKPANHRSGYPPIKCTADTEIWGVVAGVVRRYDIE